MKIYIGHSRELDYRKELYEPIRNSDFNGEHEIVLPHETEEFFSSKEIIENADLMIAEVSYPATGLGIELGRAEAANCPVVCFYKKGSKISESLKYVVEELIEYEDAEDLVNRIEEVIEKRDK